MCQHSQATIAPTMRGAAAIMYHVLVSARRIASMRASQKGVGPANEELVDLLHLIHNLPELFLNWEAFDERWFVADLEGHDKKWGSSLVATYEQAKSNRSQEAKADFLASIGVLTVESVGS